jgi:phosphoenolpyruvate carboxykinase (ATP)
MSIPNFKNVRINSQLPLAKLVKQTLALNQGLINNTGALCLNTGDFTGRSPKDTFIC